MEKTVIIKLSEVNPYIRRSNLNCIEPGFTTQSRRIYHYQIQYIYSGCGVIEIEQTVYHAKKGDLFFWGPTVPHSISASSHDPFTILGVQFDFTQNHEDKKYVCDVPDPFIYDKINEIVAFDDFQGYHHYVTVQNPTKAEQLLLEICCEYKTQKLFFQARISALFKAFLLMIARQTAVCTQNIDESAIVVDSIIEYIHENYNQNLTNQDIARQFNFHPNYISHLMKAYTGRSLHQYLINARLNRAIEMLNTTSMTISQVSTTVGFDSIHYFSQLFKKKMGYPPSKVK